MIPSTLLCTVGTSLFYPNLSRLTAAEAPALAAAFAARDWPGVAVALRERAPQDRLCGAEINSITAMIRQSFAAPDTRLCFLHSDTEDGHAVGAVLGAYYKALEHPVTVECVESLQDEDPSRFARDGLRNLARACCRQVRAYSAGATAINATGGYKAQVAIAVLLGQALAVPVYYMHERFDYVIAFPPMPVALDFDYWMEISGLLYALAGEQDGAPPTWEDFDDTDRVRIQALVNEVEIDGQHFLELSPTGQIFHEAFVERFRARMNQLLPSAVPASEKRAPIWEASGGVQKHPEVMRFMQRLTEEVPSVKRCCTFYYNPRLPKRTHARFGTQSIEAYLSDGSYLAKIRIDTTAGTPTERQVMVAAINQWIEGHWRG